MSRPFVVYCHLDILGRHPGGALSCLTGWIVAEGGYEVLALGLELAPGTLVRCNYPFFRGDMIATIQLAGVSALTGFNAILPDGPASVPSALTFVAQIAAEEGPAQPWRFTVPLRTGRTHEVRLAAPQLLAAAPAWTALQPPAVSAVLERRLFDQMARSRQLTLRLDLINKCNLRCVMCHYSDEAFARRPVQRITPEQFSSWFEPLAPITKEVVLSCGDEPLMSPHFEAILRELAARDPEVRIQFCTNGMLLTEKLARAIVAARVELVMFSFDGITSESLHRIRVGSDYRRIIRNIVGLKRERAKSGRDRPRLVFNFVMLESNVHEGPLFVAMAKRLGGDAIDFRHVVKFDLYDIEDEMLENYKPKYNFYRQRIAQAAAAAGIEVFVPPPFATAGSYDPAGDPVCTLDEFEAEMRALGDEPPAATDSGSPEAQAATERIYESAHFFCDRPFNEVMIREQRDVYPCPWHRDKMGVLDGSTNLQEIFFGENFRRVRLAMLDPNGAPGCAGCPIKSGKLPTRSL